MNYIVTTFLFTNLLTITTSTSIVAFDCGQTYANFTTFSMIDVGECDIPSDPKIVHNKTKITLLQLNQFSTTHVYICKVEVTRFVSTCIDKWYKPKTINEVDAGKMSYMEEISRNQCEQMQRHRVLHFRNFVTLPNLKANDSTTLQVQLAGHRGNSGSDCANAHYVDPYGSWTEVIVDGWVKVTMHNYDATVNLNTNQIILQTGTRCSLSDESCIDLYGGYAFWQTAPRNDCKEKYSKIYAGAVNKITDPEGKNNPIYSVETDQTTFAFSTTGAIEACSHTLLKTEHPKLFIVESEKELDNEFANQPTTENLDIFVYMNSKFVYVEKHIRNQINSLYHDLILQKCNLEKKVIANALSIAVTAPDQFAYQITGGPGYIGLVAGEVIHLIKCEFKN